MKRHGKLSDPDHLWQSQNFLHDRSLITGLLKKTSIGREDAVLEIGPGKGIITWELVKKCRKVYGIEYDFYLYQKLKERFESIGNIDIVHDDFLNYELPEKTPYKVFSSIPFNLTAQIINKLVFSPSPPEDVYLIMQKEAAVKYAGNPYGRECMRSLLLKPFFKTEIMHCFKNTDFYPVPGVSVVLLYIGKRKIPLVEQSQSHEYNDFIAYAFSRAGKDLKERLGKIFTREQFKKLAKEAEFDITCSPLELNHRQWLILFRYYAGYVSKIKKSNVHEAYRRLIKQQSKLSKIHRNRRGELSFL